MKKRDIQMIQMFKVRDDEEVRQYKAISGECQGIGTLDKKSMNYTYEGDNLGDWARFVEDTLTRSVLMGKDLPDKLVHGFG